MNLGWGILPELLDSPQPVVISSAGDGRVLDMNSAARELFGDGERVPELFGLDEGAERSYAGLDFEARAFDFMCVELRGTGEVILDSALFREGEELLRWIRSAPRAIAAMPTV